MGKLLQSIFHRRALLILFGGLILALSVSVSNWAQMSLPSPQDQSSFPARKDFLWDGFNVVVLDPGHGGGEIGAVGPEGLREKDFTLKLARKVERMLVDRLGLVVYLTREKDVAVPVLQRTASSNNRNADLLISLHSGAGFGRETSGAVICYYIEETPMPIAGLNSRAFDSLSSWRWDLAHQFHLRESAEFAKILAGKVGPIFKGEARGVPRGIIQVLQGAAMPAILMEVGTITAPSDEAILRQEETLTALASSITEAVFIFKRQIEEAVLQPGAEKLNH
ncbi:MAG: N-acetylmuramoyl-L-alanine amidase [Deltaproteobacteria bacterium]|nr:N-acetylmuramoyl-L-alanine amidase [Deltaproteobacteria bacterium]MBW2307684.1 N-acetylmuramoyl-L-alanine amidase [Deltaproteobacteria bacterium]